MNKKSRNLAITAVFLSVLGYIAGLLTAPKSGRETRKDIQKKALKAKTDAEKKLKKLHSELSSLIDDGKKRAGKAKSKAETELSKALDKAGYAKDKAREVLSAVHEGDADDKDLQQAIKEVNSAIEHLKKYVKKESKTKR